MGPAFSEASLIALGNAYQSATDWHGRKPPGA
jgi:Asp-tRNA(Asn)/Glu-tRNA(Gln) amidotransferase A subunit family amidase